MQRWNIREENGLLLNTNNPGESNYTWVSRNVGEIQNGRRERFVHFSFREIVFLYIYIFLCIFNEIVSK